MKSKNRPSMARVSKIPKQTSSIAARALNEMSNVQVANRNGRRDVCIVTTETEKSASCVMLENDVRQDHGCGDAPGDDMQVDGANVGCVVSETPCSGKANHDKFAPDSIDRGKEKFLCGNPSTWNWDSIGTLEWSEEGLCVRCNKGDGVLFCSSNDCAIAIHECCLGGPPWFDDEGGFYCPPCFLKRAIAELEEAEKAAILARNRLSSGRKSLRLFLNCGIWKELPETIPRKEAEQSKVAVDSVCSKPISGHGQQIRAKDQLVDGGIDGGINGHGEASASIVTKMNDVSLIQEKVYAKEVGNGSKNLDHQAVATADACSDREPVVENSQENIRSVDHDQVGSDIGKSVEEQRVENAAECSNGDSGVKVSLVIDRNDVSPIKTNDILLTCVEPHVKDAGNGGKNLCHQIEAATPVACRNEDLVVEDSQENGGNVDHEQVGSDIGKTVDDQQVANAAGCSNGNMGVKIPLVHERNDASPTSHAKLVHRQKKKRKVEKPRPAELSVAGANDGKDCEEDSLIVSDFIRRRHTPMLNDTEMVEPRESIGQDDHHGRVGVNTDFETGNLPQGAPEISAEYRRRKTVVQQRIDDRAEESSPERSIHPDKAVQSRHVKKVVARKSVNKHKSPKRSSNPVLPNSRRQKLPWTHEEEEMLKEAVQIFSLDIKKKMSWKAILLFGSHVFNKSRNPVDLKDKWRNMVKEGPKAKKR